MDLLSTQQLSHMKFGIDNNLPVNVNCLKNGRLKVLLPGNAEYYRETTSATYRAQRIANIANSLCTTLHGTKHPSMVEAENCSAVKTAKTFCRKISKSYRKEPCVENLRRQLLASRLAIPIEAFDANAGFYEFTSKNYLYHYMRFYDHGLEVDSKTYEMKILSEGQWKTWADVRDAVTTPLPKLQPKQPWVYGPRGVQNKDMYEWKELTPFQYDDPGKWGNQWILEICACNESTPQKTGDHSWVRLKTPEGEIYSIGLYRPDKSSFSDNIKDAFKITKGHLMQPDLSEYYPCNIHTIQYKITEEIFKKIKDQIEGDKRKDEEIFQPIGTNCTQYVNKIAALAGIRLPTKTRIWRILTPKPCEKIIDAIGTILPNLIKRICNVITAFFLNLLMVCLGGAKKDPTIINGCGQPVTPYIHSFSDLFDPEKASLHHPHTLGWKVYRSINKWRQEQLKELRKKLRELIKSSSDKEESIKKQIVTIKERIDGIPFDIPPEYKFVPE
jgi:hypothetical protein